MAGTPRRITAWIQIAVAGLQESTERVNTFSYRWDGSAGGPGPATLLTMANAWWTACGTQYRAMCAANYNALTVTARWLDPAGPAYVAVYNIPQPAPGTSSGLAHPGNVTAVISWRTPLAGRAFRGRTYLPAITENNTSNSTLTAPYITAAIALANAILGFNNGGGVASVKFAVASFSHLVMVEVATFVIDNLVDSMRRRLLGRGR